MNRDKRISRLTSGMIRLAGNQIATSIPENRRLSILTYHRILGEPDSLLESEPDTATFGWHMELLAQSFNVLPLSDAMNALRNGNLPPRAVCITFDDGYRSVHDLALPILKKLSLPATVFVTTGHLQNGCMWNDEIIAVLKTLTATQIDLQEFGLGNYVIGTHQNRKKTIFELIEASKYLSPTIRSSLVRKISSLANKAPPPDLMLTQEMVRNLSNEGVEIGAHTVNHPILTRLDDESADYEINACKKHLEEITGKPVLFFAYPNGKFGIDFDHRHMQMARDAGYSHAFTTSTGAATRKNGHYQIPRSRPWDKTPFFYALRLLRWLGSETA